MRNDITVRGYWMYPRDATYRMADLIRAGLLDLCYFVVTIFDLDHANDAVEQAAANAGAFRMTVIQP